MSINIDILNLFSERASFYDSAKWVTDSNILDSIASSIPSIKGLKILDLGCGTGTVSLHILKKCDCVDKMYAVDINPKMLDQIKDSRIEIHVADVVSLPFPNNFFDIIVSRQCLHYVENIDSAIFEIKRVLKSNGLFTLTQFVPLEGKTKQYWIELMRIRQPLRKYFYSENEWCNAFQRHGFKVINIKKCALRYSIKKWAHTYNRSINSNCYIELIRNAPLSYIKEYNVEINEDDIKTTAHSSTIVFIDQC